MLRARDINIELYEQVGKWRFEENAYTWKAWMAEEAAENVREALDQQRDCGRLRPRSRQRACRLNQGSQGFGGF